MISVCLASYNGEAYISEQVSSILAQLSPEDEVIVSDDGSSDGTLEKIHGFNDPRIRLLQGPRQGLIANFQNALLHAHGDIIILSDQDDVWLPGRLESVVSYLRDHDLVVCDCTVVDRDLGLIAPSFYLLNNSGPGLLKNLVSNSYQGCCMAFRKRILELALPFPVNIPMHDWWLGLVAELYGRVYFFQQPGLLYRRHDANQSSTAQISTIDLSTRIRWRLGLIVALISRAPAALRARRERR
ncbi:alpha-L-Rha alpha-1,3-L-rhamnosyltransferase [Pseudomonas sp. Pc102]|uniref:glycosyltransferase family 2 protein n=1 Tax=Pseudomonas sp. Pc102 TaxID=2678261 RepID=UPI001BCE1DA8|nr:glycosyltransferase family 2 protein [Pseudomonas sp. Pc102]BBP81940.1 alpha-L-Rha alpha-1,3-L-rhamnosyltransferase [Pseudomonas sp. Pc102]